MKYLPNNKPVYIALSIAVLLFVLILIVAPREIDWSLSYSKNDKIPFGNSIAFELLPELFQPNEILVSHTSLIDFLKNNTLSNTNYIVVNNVYEPDSFEINTLLSQVEQGNVVFIAAAGFSDHLQKKLKIEIQHNMFQGLQTGFSYHVNFANKKLKAPNDYEYSRMTDQSWFTSYDSLHTTVLGYDETGKTNFIKTTYGNGYLLINTLPLAFTNYYMLKNDNHEYIFKSLSYMPRQATIWDEYYKPRQAVGRSKIEFILKNPSLKYAWYLFLISALVFLVFETKRRQRLIPIIAPPENTSLSFIETIGRLYFNRQNHLDLARKKYIYFIDFVRSKYHINITELTTEGLNELSDKSGQSVRNITQIIEMGNRLSSFVRLSEEDLIQFNQKIEFFYHQCK